MGNKVGTVLWKNGITIIKDDMAASEMITSDEFPFYVKKNVAITFRASFDSFKSITFGKGYNSYRGDWFEINDTEIIRYHCEESEPATSVVEHGLSVSKYLMGSLFFDDEGTINISIITISGTYSVSFATDYNVLSGAVFLTTGGNLKSVKLSAGFSDAQKPLWFLGDSYLGLNADRVLGQLKALGFFDGYLSDSLAGATTHQMADELQRLLKYETPEYLIIYTGMNDGTLQDYQTPISAIKEMCHSNGIELILNRVPSVPGRDKSEIGEYIASSGLRYIDSTSAVGATSEGTWYGGYLNTDNNVHPTETGAKALAMQAIIDVPEIMMYGYGRSNAEGMAKGDH